MSRRVRAGTPAAPSSPSPSSHVEAGDWTVLPHGEAERGEDDEGVGAPEDGEDELVAHS